MCSRLLLIICFYYMRKLGSNWLYNGARKADVFINIIENYNLYNLD